LWHFCSRWRGLDQGCRLGFTVTAPATQPLEHLRLGHVGEAVTPAERLGVHARAEVAARQHGHITEHLL